MRKLTSEHLKKLWIIKHNGTFYKIFKVGIYTTSNSRIKCCPLSSTYIHMITKLKRTELCFITLFKKKTPQADLLVRSPRNVEFHNKEKI